ncbi:MAG: hypothetical protein PHY47_01365 [Lachnospiraceae bacterium]|nr:hypothetical protein [Lachnospiraceae bacterium]
MRFLLIVFLLVISDPYKDIDYAAINTYDINYSNHYQSDGNESYDSDYLDSEEVEEIEEDVKDEYRYEEQKPLIFPVDFFNS